MLANMIQIIDAIITALAYVIVGGSVIVLIGMSLFPPKD